MGKNKFPIDEASSVDYAVILFIMINRIIFGSPWPILPRARLFQEVKIGSKQQNLQFSAVGIFLFGE